MNLNDTLLILLTTALAGCGGSNPNAGDMKQSPLIIDVQGHRGCRGLMPENTIAGFVEAIALGATTIELDLVISGDRQVIVSHDHYFSPVFCLDPNGDTIPQASARAHNIYQMTLAEIQSYDCGLKFHPGFPDQQKMPAVKPTLAATFEAVEAWLSEHLREGVRYNIEIKRQPQLDGIFHPDAAEFARLVIEVIDRFEVRDRVNIQSFDFETLEEVRTLAPDIPLAVLIETEGSTDEYLARLSFTPEIYSPHYELISVEEVQKLQSQGLKVIPWTVNEVPDMQRLISWGVDGIITDYPDRLVGLL